VTITFNEPKFAIEPTDFRCAACTSEVAVQAAFYSAVFFETETFRRRSFCTSCWEGPAGKPRDAYAFWKSKRPAPEAKPRKLRFDADMVLDFFRKLSAEDISGAPEKVRLRLVLALLLVRRKVLVLESSGLRDGREWIKLTEKSDPGRVHYVENPPLSDAELEQVRVSLGELLQMEV